MVIPIHPVSQSPLTQVIDTLDDAGFFPGSGQGSQKHRRQKRDDGDDDQHFDEGERPSPHVQ